MATAAFVAAMAGAPCAHATGPLGASATVAPSEATTLSQGTASVLRQRVGLLQIVLEAEVLTLVNLQRLLNGCPPLRLDKQLRKAARRHSRAMARANIMAHQLEGEAAFTRRITRAGYRWQRVAENVALGFDSAQSVMDAWMNSPDHRTNILDCRLQDIGVGIVLHDGALWWTQDFGAA